ncbi:hypothetical protein AVEN_58811-1 [Araneus ventricosus]|uniref:Uncharacterized protein n=1 Tax=Araneus ventricosus TaxID=182803 RepID=A0A4Y2SXG3_ARAVE|nr:hypothetical protein AVEN_58811-1 [Araneus ventricosus]
MHPLARITALSRLGIDSTNFAVSELDMESHSCICSAPSYCDVYKSVSTFGQGKFLLSSGLDARLRTQRYQAPILALPQWRPGRTRNTYFQSHY